MKGSYYEIGLSIGRKFRKQVPSHYSKECTKEKLDFAYDCQDIVKKYCPELLEELQGIADAGNFNYENLLSSELAAGLYSNCTLLAISGEHTKSGHPIFARSMDWLQYAMKFASISMTRPKGKLASLGFSETFLGRAGGINEAGLAIGESSTCWENLQPGIISGVAIRWILDNCKTSHDAVEFLTRIRFIMGNNYLIADKQGDFGFVQAHPSKAIGTIERPDFLFATNHYFSPEFDKITPKKPKHSTDRIEYLNSWFSKRTEPVSLEDVMILQRTHDVEICPHVQEEYEGKPRDLTTCWAWTAALGTNEVYLCEGSPCKNQHQRLVLS